MERHDGELALRACGVLLQEAAREEIFRVDEDLDAESVAGGQQTTLEDIARSLGVEDVLDELVAPVTTRSAVPELVMVMLSYSPSKILRTLLRHKLPIKRSN